MWLPLWTAIIMWPWPLVTFPVSDNLSRTYSCITCIILDWMTSSIHIYTVVMAPLFCILQEYDLDLHTKLSKGQTVVKFKLSIGVCLRYFFFRIFFNFIHRGQLVIMVLHVTIVLTVLIYFSLWQTLAAYLILSFLLLTWDQPALCKMDKVSGSRKQQLVLVGFELMPDQRS